MAMAAEKIDWRRYVLVGDCYKAVSNEQVHICANTYCWQVRYVGQIRRTCPRAIIIRKIRGRPGTEGWGSGVSGMQSKEPCTAHSPKCLWLFIAPVVVVPIACPTCQCRAYPEKRLRTLLNTATTMAMTMRSTASGQQDVLESFFRHIHTREHQVNALSEQ